MRSSRSARCGQQRAIGTGGDTRAVELDVARDPTTDRDGRFPPEDLSPRRDHAGLAANFVRSAGKWSNPPRQPRKPGPGLVAAPESSP